MKTGNRIQVTESAPYKGQDMNWSETFTGIKIIGNTGEWVTHISDKKISAFAAKNICVHTPEHSESYFNSELTKSEVDGKFTIDHFIYSIFLPAGSEVECYGEDEYRFFLSTSYDVVFSGVVKELKVGQGIGRNGKPIDLYKKYSTCKY